MSQHHIMKHSKGEKKYLVNAESKAKNEKAQTPWIFGLKKGSYREWQGILGLPNLQKFAKNTFLAWFLPIPDNRKGAH